eukprot:TRINITY_DN7919_c0_g1_i1.p1 TRINITY_DN7919_c0_g1~~TRINITY_DN7919_c0_g1_i1.p1  ORF type:complete len:219 (-),score=39.98 TRINITY_DN7919_c0_g1_i1:245-901(-)
MELLRSNYRQYMARLHESIRKSLFVAIDTELTGLHRTPDHGPSFVDSIQMRYQKLSDSVRSFTVTQYGICTFSWDSKHEKIVADPYYFYVFPVPPPYNLEGRETSYVGFSPDGFCFLANEKFDFNKWVKQGVPYMSRLQEEIARKTIVEKASNAVKNDPIAVTKQIDIDFLENIIKQVAEFASTDAISMKIPNANPYQRRLIYQELPAKLVIPHQCPC